MERMDLQGNNRNRGRNLQLSSPIWAVSRLGGEGAQTLQTLRLLHAKPQLNC